MAQIQSPSPVAQSPIAASPSQVNAAVTAYAAILELPGVTKASFLPGASNGTNLLLETSHRSISQLSKQSATQTLVLSSTNELISTSPLAFTAPEVQHTSYSPDGTRSAVFRSLKPEGKEKKLLVEIWDLLAAVKEEELELQKEHGDWYFDDTFGAPTWHPAGHALLYTAEPLTPSCPTPSASTFLYTADFGEKFTGKRFPTVFLLALASSPFHKSLSTKPALHQLTNHTTFPSTSFGQAIFLPSSDGRQTPRVLATGYSSLGDARKLGIVYCANRPAGIYEFGLSLCDSTWSATTATLQSPAQLSCRSPRALHPPPGAKFGPLVVFLANPAGGPHSSCAALHAVSLASSQTTVLVPVVSTPVGPDAFPGLYLDQLPQNPFVMTPDGPAVVLSSSWRSRKVPIVVSLMDGRVSGLAPWPERSENDVVLPWLGEKKREALKSISVLGTDGGSRVVGLRSGMVGPAELVVADLSARMVEWKIVKAPKPPSQVLSALAKLDWTVLPLPKFEPSEILLISPVTIDPSAESRLNLPPLITIPHGGPHAAFTTEFSAQMAALAIAGYRVALVNYPGSLGFGQDFVDALPPHLGQLDVDATLATSHYLNTLSLASRTKGKKLLMGGSHGGYISAHLSGRHPEEYDAVVMRNPVVDLPSMLYATDIPDWVFAEALLPYSFDSPPTSLDPETYARLHALSPLANVGNVVVPTLLLVGQDDRRVPPDQSRAWYHALKALGKGEVDMLTFPGEGHDLARTVEVEVVGFEAGLRFLEKYTNFQ